MVASSINRRIMYIFISFRLSVSCETNNVHNCIAVKIKGLNTYSNYIAHMQKTGNSIIL